MVIDEYHVMEKNDHWQYRHDTVSVNDTLIARLCPVDTRQSNTKQWRTKMMSCLHEYTTHDCIASLICQRSHHNNHQSTNVCSRNFCRLAYWLIRSSDGSASSRSQKSAQPNQMNPGSMKTTTMNHQWNISYTPKKYCSNQTNIASNYLYR